MEQIRCAVRTRPRRARRFVARGPAHSPCPRPRSLIYSGRQLYAARARGVRPVAPAPWDCLTAAPLPRHRADSNTLESYGVKPGGTLHMVLALRGGF